MPCHRGKSVSESSRFGEMAPAYLTAKDDALGTQKTAIKRIIADYKLLWETCPACGDPFEPGRPDLIDLHHPGELHGIFDGEGNCLVLPKAHNVSQMHLDLTNDECIALLPHEVVKTVPIHCTCHWIITHYASKRCREYYQTNHLPCENVQEYSVPFGIGVVRVPEEGTLFGPGSNIRN